MVLLWKVRSGSAGAEPVSASVLSLAVPAEQLSRLAMQLAPPLALVLSVLVLAVILLGITTATESAAVGAAGAFLLAFQARTLDWKKTKEAVLPKSQQHLRCVRHQLPSRSSSRAAFQHPPEVAWWSCWLPVRPLPARCPQIAGRPNGPSRNDGNDRMSCL